MRLIEIPYKFKIKEFAVFLFDNTKYEGILMKKLFFKHEWGNRLRIEMFAVLSGDRFNVVCKKRGKVKGLYFRKYSENGIDYI